MVNCKTLGYLPKWLRLSVKTLNPGHCQNGYGEKNKGIQCQNSGDTVNPQTLIDDVIKRDIPGYSPMRTQNKIFISYSHKDTETLEQLQTYLKPLERENLIDRWDDTRIKTSMKWKEEIQKSLKSCKIAILLVSQAFFASDFIANDELPPLLEAAEAEGLEILAIILDRCKTSFEGSPLKEYQTANPPSQPLSSLNNDQRGRILDNLAARIKEIVKNEK
jgi:hypothetical protein